MRRTLIVFVSAMIALAANAQTTLLADFEDGTAGKLKINKDYQGSLFSVKPRVMDNPVKTANITMAASVMPSRSFLSRM